MPLKYKCTKCARSFVHKETLEEHSHLHGIIIKDGYRYKCPVCLKQVTCHHESGRHMHDEADHEPKNLKNNGYTSSTEVLAEDRVICKGEVSDDEQHSALTSSRKGNPLKIVENETAASEISDNIRCIVCSKTFVYHKRLLRHLTNVHGIAAENCKKVISDTENCANVLIAHTDSFEAFDKKESQLQKHNSLHSVDCRTVSKSSQCKTVVTSEKIRSCDEADVTGISAEGECTSQFNTPHRIVTRSSKHKKEKFHESTFTCTKCTKTFKYKTTLVRHWRVVHSGMKCDKCICPLCKRVFDSQKAFSRHFDTAHKKAAAKILSDKQKNISDEFSNDQVARCETCHRWFTCRKSLLKHCGLKHRVVKSSETGKVHYKCIHCEETFDTDKQLLYHRHSKHYLSKQRDDVQGTSANETGHVTENNLIRSEISNDDLSSDGTVDNYSDIDQNRISESSKKRSNRESSCVCSECSKGFASSAFLQRHIKLKHTNRNVASDRKIASEKQRKSVFVCGACSEEFNSEEALSDHMSFIHKHNTSELGECLCPVCSLRFPDQLSFSGHFEMNHNLPMEHVGSMSDKVSRCNDCGHWFTDSRTLSAHQCPMKPPVRLKPAGRARYRCTECGEAFEVLRRFLHHRKAKHRVEGPVVSEMAQQPKLPQNFATAELVCGESATANSVEDPALHCMRGRPPKLLDAGVDPSEILHVQNSASDTLLMPFLQKNSAVGLMQNDDSNVVSHKCPECGRLFQTVSLLRKHRKAEHRNRTCQLCGETCKSADMVYYHNLKFHHEQKCDVCGASCAGRLGLIQHFRSEHPKEPLPVINRKTLICEYCPRVFAGCASRLLRDHIESCHLGRVHLCDVCGKRLGSAQTLAVHRRMHDPVARFACHECNRRFPHNTNLINHIRKHHPERLPAKYVREFHCEICSMKFGSSSGLTRHRSEKHGSSRHQCDQCLRVFQSLAGLRVHKRREHMPKESVDDVLPADQLIQHQQPPVLQQQQQPILIVPVTFSDPTLMAGIIAGVPSINHGFQ